MTPLRPLVVTGAVALAAALLVGIAPAARAQGGAPAGAVPVSTAPEGEGSGGAAAAAETAAPAGIRKVEVGMFVNQIPTMSLRDNCFEVDFYVWFRWTPRPGDEKEGSRFDPLESFAIVNGEIESKSHEYRAQRGDIMYATCRVKAKVIKFWDVREFPLGGHDLQIFIEDNDNESDKLQYVADLQNCNISKSVQVPGWTVKRAWPIVMDHTYTTNYGDPALPQDSPSTYSRFIYTVEIVRPGYGMFIKLHIGLFISAMLAFLALLIKPTNVDPRFGLGIGAIFAAVSLQFVIESSLPEADVVTLADKLHKIAFAFIFLTIAQSTLSLKLVENGKEEASKSFDRLSFVIMIALYIAANVWTVAYR